MTHGIEFDVTRYPLVIMRAGASYTQADWEQLMKRMIEVIQMGPFGLINDTRDSPMPDALQRRSIAQMCTDYDVDVRRNFLASGIVGSSSLVNGVLTAPHATRQSICYHRCRGQKLGCSAGAPAPNGFMSAEGRTGTLREAAQTPMISRYTAGIAPPRN